MPKAANVKIDTCDGCAKDKKIIFIGKVNQYDRPERTTHLCKNCFHELCFCSICFEKTTYSSYERHLLKKHTSNQMAKLLLNEKVFFDHF